MRLFVFGQKRERGPKCLFIAPYSPAESGAPAFGAAKKIRLACEGFKQNQVQVFFLNTANNTGRNSCFKLENHFPGDVVCCNFFPNIYPRSLGRFLFILIAPFLGLFLALVLKPRIIWVYNLGAGEMLAGYFAGLFADVKILEVEDMPFSRRRGFGEFKPKVDQIFSKLIKHCFNTYLFVSKSVQSEVGVAPGRRLVVPGIISEIKVHRVVHEKLPTTVGFFGGFDRDKGADILVGLLKNRDRDWRYIICGGGSETTIAAALQADLGDRLFVRESDSVIERLQGECHVFLNPHRPLADMEFGVFPFKIAEYLNSPAIVITTNLGVSSSFTNKLGVKTVAWSVADFYKEIQRSLALTGSMDLNVLRSREKFLSGLIAKRLIGQIINGTAESETNTDAI